MLPTKTKDPSIEIIAKFLSDKKVLIVDEGSSSRSSVMHLIVQMGARPFNVAQAKSFADAEIEMKQNTPGVVLTEFSLGKHCGLELLQAQRASNPDTKKSLFFLLTSNTSQSAVARAAEEDVDAFILKPYSPDSFKRIFLKAAMIKLQPPGYLLEIEAGKVETEKGNFEKAEAHFTQAMTMDPQPALACYYLGQIKYIKKALDQSKGSYVKGLDYNKIHYRCLVGLYELLMSQKNHAQAYEVVKKVSQYFPANPKRLAEVLHLAIINKCYDDVEKYYAVFCNIDERNDILIKYICAALVICGKYYVMTGSRARALELFQKAAITSAGRTKILTEIIRVLVDYRMGQEAQKFLVRYPADSHEAAEYLNASFQIEALMSPASVAIVKGRKLVSSAMATEKSYETLIRLYIELKSLNSAEETVSQASAKFPAAKDAFAKILEEAKEAA